MTLTTICGSCRRVRVAAGDWRVASVGAGAQQAAALCPDCIERQYRQVAGKVLRSGATGQPELDHSRLDRRPRT